jgi:hypothetical protein
MIRGANEIELHRNMNKEDGPCMHQSWKPLIHWKKGRRKPWSQEWVSQRPSQDTNLPCIVPSLPTRNSLSLLHSAHPKLPIFTSFCHIPHIPYNFPYDVILYLPSSFPLSLYPQPFPIIILQASNCPKRAIFFPLFLYVQVTSFPAFAWSGPAPFTHFLSFLNWLSPPSPFSSHDST